MAKLSECRLLTDGGAHSGAWNMAVDAALLESAVLEGRATFRWYRWSEPTLSLGYFQDAAEVDAHPTLSAIPRVRRLTGGGAIVHHHEWTYSFAVPARSLLFDHPLELYHLVHEALIDVLHRGGCPAELRGASRPVVPEPFLCFLRQDAHDVVLHGRKIVGSAQRRRKGAVLQHGSLLLRHASFAPEAPGLADLGHAGCLRAEELADLPGRWSERIVPGELSADELRRIDALLTQMTARE
jgi:lipoate-protein ligase A